MFWRDNVNLPVLKREEQVATLMIEFNKVVGEIFYDVAHLFEHPKVNEEAIGDVQRVH